MSKANDDIDVLVIRDGRIQHINVNEIVIGDIIQMDTGDKIPCDGVLLKCDMLEVDESDLTGESNEIVKSLKNDPFVLSGCRVTAGTGVFVACSG